MTQDIDMQALRDEFTAWVATKPKYETYNYIDNNNCAFGQFMTTEHPEMNCRFVGGTFWRDADDKQHDFCVGGGSDSFCLALQAGTFGALLDRLNS
jgi:hypothetical protein